MEDSKAEQIELTVDSTNADQSPPLRLDQFLADRLAQFSRARIQKLISEGAILVDGRVEKASHRLKPKQKVVLIVPPAKELAVQAEPIPLDVVYDDKYLAVINKPAGMVTHPGAGVDSGTLVHALLHHLGSSLS